MKHGHLLAYSYLLCIVDSVFMQTAEQTVHSYSRGAGVLCDVRKHLCLLSMG